MTGGSYAERMASKSLELYRSEGTFEIEFAPALDTNKIAEAYEKLGCLVKRSQRANALTVVVPGNTSNTG